MQLRLEGKPSWCSGSVSVAKQDFKSKSADRRKNWNVMNSWLSSQVPLLLGGTVTTGGIPGKTVSTT